MNKKHSNAFKNTYKNTYDKLTKIDTNYIQKYT